MFKNVSAKISVTTSSTVQVLLLRFIPMVAYFIPTAWFCIHTKLVASVAFCICVLGHNEWVFVASRIFILFRHGGLFHRRKGLQYVEAFNSTYFDSIIKRFI